MPIVDRRSFVHVTAAALAAAAARVSGAEARGAVEVPEGAAGPGG